MIARAVTFQFVDTVPSEREDATLYISIKYRTAIHSCFCGCGSKVVTPIRPTGWRLTYDGDTISLHPSIGNWSFRCRSHYWIRNNRALPAGNMSQAAIEAGRRHDQAEKDAYFGVNTEPPEVNPPSKATPRKRGFWAWLLGWQQPP